LLDERDLINGIPPDKEFKRPFSDGGWQYEPLLDLGAKKDEVLKYFEESVYYSPLDTVPCPPGLTQSECDTLEALARYELGFEGPSSNFQYIVPLSDAQEAEEFEENEVYVVPNPATRESLEPWRLDPNQDDPTGIKVEFRNLPKCRCTVRIYTVSGDLVEVLDFDGTSGHGTLAWDLVSRNGQDVTSGIYLFSVEPEDDRFPRTVGKFVVIR